MVFKNIKSLDSFTYVLNRKSQSYLNTWEQSINFSFYRSYVNYTIVTNWNNFLLDGNKTTPSDPANFPGGDAWWQGEFNEGGINYKIVFQANVATNISGRWFIDVQNYLTHQSGSSWPPAGQTVEKCSNVSFQVNINNSVWISGYMWCDGPTYSGDPLYVYNAPGDGSSLSGATYGTLGYSKLADAVTLWDNDNLKITK